MYEWFIVIVVVLVAPTTLKFGYKLNVDKKPASGQSVLSVRCQAFWHKQACRQMDKQAYIRAYTYIYDMYVDMYIDTSLLINKYFWVHLKLVKKISVWYIIYVGTLCVSICLCVHLSTTSHCLLQCNLGFALLSSLFLFNCEATLWR